MPAQPAPKQKDDPQQPWPPVMPVTVDVALFTVRELERRPELSVVLIGRNEPPFEGEWALPGGFVLPDEDLDAAAQRVADQETAVTRVQELEQVGAVGTVDRDPRSRVVTILYVALIPSDRQKLRATGGAAGVVDWFSISRLPRLAFDHDELLKRALAHLRRNLLESGACFRLLPKHFTLGELQRLYETVLGMEGRRLDRANFRRRLLREGAGAGSKQGFAFLEPIPGQRKPARPRPAQLYRFVPEAFERYVEERRQKLA